MPLGGEFAEGPGNSGSAPAQAALRMCALADYIGGVERPAPVCRIELPLRARRDVGDRLARSGVAERPVTKGLVTGRREELGWIVGSPVALTTLPTG
jgi:hypothetical protein